MGGGGGGGEMTKGKNFMGGGNGKNGMGGNDQTPYRSVATFWLNSQSLSQFVLLFWFAQNKT